MAGNRKAAEALALKIIQEMDPSGINAKIYREKVFGPLSDKEFAQLMADYKTGARYPVIYAPNYGPVKLDVKRNIEVGRKLGREYFEHIHFSGVPGVPDYTTPQTFFVVPAPIRRQAQLVTKGVSVPKNMKTINALTGQPTGDSQSAKLSIPELQFCAGSGLKQSMRELYKLRGGDIKGYAALQGMLVSLGRASQKNVLPFSSGTEVNRYLRTLFAGAHIGINL